MRMLPYSARSKECKKCVQYPETKGVCPKCDSMLNKMYNRTTKSAFSSERSDGKC